MPVMSVYGTALPSLRCSKIRHYRRHRGHAAGPAGAQVGHASSCAAQSIQPARSWSRSAGLRLGQPNGRDGCTTRICNGRSLARSPGVLLRAFHLRANGSPPVQLHASEYAPGAISLNGDEERWMLNQVIAACLPYRDLSAASVSGFSFRTACADASRSRIPDRDRGYRPD
jgi:hypothetical protein